MKKILISLLLVLTITGCSSTYNLNVGDKISEDITINVPNSLSTTKLNEIDENIRLTKPIIDDFEDQFNYNINTTNKNGNKVYNLKYTYDNFNESSVAPGCFENFDFSETKSYYVIKASGYFGCLYDNENVKININTDKYVSKNNADKVNKNTYTWNINKNNRNKTNINITIMKNIEDQKTPLSKIIKNIFKVAMILALIIGAIYLYLQEEKNTQNP